MLLDIIKILARQSLVFRGDNDDDSSFVQIMNLISKNNPILKPWMNSNSKRKYKTTYMSPRNQNEFIKQWPRNVAQSSSRK